MASRAGDRRAARRCPPCARRAAARFAFCDYEDDATVAHRRASRGRAPRRRRSCCVPPARLTSRAWAATSSSRRTAAGARRTRRAQFDGAILRRRAGRATRRPRAVGCRRAVMAVVDRRRPICDDERRSCAPTIARGSARRPADHPTGGARDERRTMGAATRRAGRDRRASSDQRASLAERLKKSRPKTRPPQAATTFLR